MDRFDAMSAFLAVADAGGFSAAARRLGTPLATVSRRVAELEQHLGARLLERSTRRVALTETGARFLAECRIVLDRLAEAERAAAGEFEVPRGALGITAPIVFGRLHVAPVVAGFLEAYPEVQVRLMLADRVVDLMEEHMDLAVRIGALPDSRLTAVTIGSIGHVVCASPAHLARRGTPAHPRDLARHDCVAFTASPALQSWEFRDGAYPVRPRLSVTTAETALDAAIAGLGVTRVLSYQAADAIRRKRLAVVLRRHMPDPAPLSLVYGSGRPLPLKLRAFLDFAAPRLKARMAALREV